MFYTGQRWERPCLSSRLRAHAQSHPGDRLHLDCTSLAGVIVPCLALNPLKTNYNTITVIALLKMETMEPVARERRTSPRLCLSFSVTLCLHLCPTPLLSQLAAAGTIDIITVMSRERREVLTDEFLLWPNEIWKMFCGAVLTSTSQKRLNDFYTCMKTILCLC